MQKICLKNSKKQIFELSAHEMVGMVSNRELTASEIANASIQRVKEAEKDLLAWAYFEKDNLIKQAEKIDQKITEGQDCGMLAGVPVGIKDVFNTQDMPTCMGSPLWKDFNPGNDARVVFRLREEDAIVAGKTVTAELAVHEPGPTRNPHNLDYYPGTSSSGSAVAVASGMVPVALGTQTAGSIIRPASYCGVYGFKPSFGTLPRTGVLKTTDTLDQIGFFARNIEDIELMFDALRVKGPNYPFVNKLIDNREEAEYKKGKWRIAAVEHTKWNFADEYAKKAFSEFMERLSGLKELNINKTQLPSVFNEAHDKHATIYNKCLSYYFNDEYKKKHFVSKVLSGMIEKGLEITPEEYYKAMDVQVTLREELEEFFCGYDLILTLSTSGEAPLLAEPNDKPDSCLVWNLCGFPALNVPVFKGPKGLPFGLQVVARRYDDLLIARFVKMLKDKGFVEDINCIA